MFGPLAGVDADARVHWARLPMRSGAPFPLDLDVIQTLPRVDVALSYAGSDGAAIRGLLAAGNQALVVAGLPPGRPAQGEVAALRAAVEAGVVVVMSTRASRGQVPVQTFLDRERWLAGGDLAPLKLRILLMLILTQTRDVALIQEWITHA